VALFCIVAFANSARSVVGLSDTLGNTWTLVRRNTEATGLAVELWKAHCPTGGANTITCDWDAATSPQVHISEFDSFPNNVTLDQSNEQDNSATLTPNYGSITTTQATSVVIAGGRTTTAFDVVTVGDGCTAFTYGTRQVSHYKVLSGTETLDCDLLMLAAETVCCVIANFYNSSPTISDLRWQARYPDRISPLPTLAAAILAGACFFVNLETGPKIESWTQPASQPIFLPNRLPGLTAGVTWVPQHQAAEGSALDWTPNYPDFIWEAPRPPEFPALALPPPSVQPLGHAGWLPLYPDYNWPAARTSEFPAIFTGQTGSTIPYTDLRWQGWQPSQLDRLIVRAADHAPLFFYPFPYPPVTATIEWLPTYPDYNRQTARVPEFAPFAPPPFSVQPLGHVGWRSTYPDYNWPVARVVDFPAIFTGQMGSTIPYDDLRWQGTYPDQIDRLKIRAGDQPFLAFYPFPYPPVAATIEWLPIYPDYLWQLGHPAEFVALVAPPPSVQPLGHVGWRSTYPDQIDRRLASPHIWPFFWLNPVPPVTVNLLSAWAFYPDQIDRKIVHPSRVPSVFQSGRVALPDAAVPPLSWEGSQPDQVDRQRLLEFSSYFSVPFARATELTQYPRFPDQVARPQVRPADLQSLAIKLEAIPTELSWRGSQPDFVYRAAAVPAQVAFVFYSLPVADPDPAGLGYQTALYPDWVLPPQGLLSALRPAFAFHSVPIPNAAPPTDTTWLPIYPNFLPVRSFLERASELLFAPIGIASGLHWLPAYPSLFIRPTAFPVEIVLPFGGVLAVPGFASWRPAYPDQIARVPLGEPHNFSGFGPFVIPPLLPPPDCLEWTADLVDASQILSESLTRSGIINEDAAGPSVKVEKSC
jgi:hypothetical protein